MKPKPFSKGECGLAALRCGSRFLQHPGSSVGLGWVHRQGLPLDLLGWVVEPACGPWVVGVLSCSGILGCLCQMAGVLGYPTRVWHCGGSSLPAVRES